MVKIVGVVTMLAGLVVKIVGVVTTLAGLVVINRREHFGRQSYGSQNQ